MAHIPGHIDPRVDQALIDAGVAGGTLPERRNPRPDVRTSSPTLFDSTAQNLFGEINMRVGGRAGDLLGTLFGRVLPPSKKQKAAFAQLKKERAQKIERARSGAVSEFAAASGLSTPAARSAALASPELGRSLEATARGGICQARYDTTQYDPLFFAIWIRHRGRGEKRLCIGVQGVLEDSLPGTQLNDLTQI